MLQPVDHGAPVAALFATSAPTDALGAAFRWHGGMVVFKEMAASQLAACTIEPDRVARHKARHDGYGREVSDCKA
ncbi:hypothetical protein MASR2M74_17340 [Paracoccaceae bacterium]